MFDYIRKNRLSLIVLLTAWAVFFCRTLSGKSVYFLDDLKIIFYPLEAVYAQFQHHWQLPVWSPLFGMGQPLLGWGQLGFFAPLHMVLRALYVPPLALLQISIVTYFAVGLLGMFMFLRRRSFPAAAAIIGALTFAFSGFFVGHLNHVNFYTVSLLLPWLLYAVDWFLDRPNARTAAGLSLIATAIVVSGQPQVVLYTFIIATLFGLLVFVSGTWAVRQDGLRKYVMVRIGWLFIAGVAAFCLSSMAILPLREFLPLTERADALTEADLLDFSYAPEHAITLIFPYFFGDHTIYWGAKNFQELAAYVGLLPLLLSGAALVSSWRRYKTERVWSILLIIIAIVFALGRYSVVYTWLVQNKYITSLSIAGRFVYFFDVGVAVLAAVGLATAATLPKWRRGLMLLVGILALVGLLYPFSQYIQHDAAVMYQWQAIMTLKSPFMMFLVVSAISFIAWLFITRWPVWTARLNWWLVFLVAVTLISYGWQYNPLTPTAQAFRQSPFAATLLQTEQQTGVPARLYAAESLPVTGDNQLSLKLTESISPTFTVHQPLIIESDSLSCLYIPMFRPHSGDDGVIMLTLRGNINGNILAATSITNSQVSQRKEQSFCFPAVTGKKGQTLVVSFTSETDSGIRLLYTSTDEGSLNAYVVRPKNPTPAQLEASRKPVAITMNQTEKPVVDNEAKLLERHIQAAAGVSGVRWIGALSILPYRAWVESFFANDADNPFNGDGVHALAQHKNLVDVTGITYFTQSMARTADHDPMVEAGYELVQEDIEYDQAARLYKNNQAFPRAFLIRNAVFQPVADEARELLGSDSFDPKTHITVDGPTPPQNLLPERPGSAPGTAHITLYEPTRVDISVDTPEEAWLVLTESSTPQWLTFIDNQPAPYYTADTFFRTARVSSGQHTVSFRYKSPAVEQAKVLMVIGFLIIVALYAWPYRRHSINK